MKDPFAGLKPKRKRRKRKRDIRESQAALMRERRASERDISEIEPPLDPARRDACKLDLRLFLETYLADRFDMAWSRTQLRCIEKLQYIVLHGGLFALAMPRGGGKTATAVGAAIWAMLYGHKRYTVLVAATSVKGEQLIRGMRITLRFNQLMREDFPSIIVPIREAQGNALRAKSQTYRGEAINMEWATTHIVFPTMPDCPASGAIVEAAGITGDIRGRQRVLTDGSIIRPDLAICDDPSTKESARSLSQNNFREEVIRGDVLGLAGPGKAIACAVPCTIIEDGDLADRLTNVEKCPDFQGEVSGAIVTWPKGHDQDGSLWLEYNDVRIRGIREKDQGAAANEFYIRHRAELEKGAEVDWDGWKEAGDVSALQSLMNKYYSRGKKAFFSEYQNTPWCPEATVYTLTADQVASNLNGYARYQIPTDAPFVTCMVDINYVGLNYVTTAWQTDFTGFVVDYGKHPEGGQNYLIQPKSDEITISRSIQAGLITLMEVLARKPYHRDNERHPIDLVLIDGNWRTEVVHRLIRQLRQSQRLTIAADRGRPDQRYRLPAKGNVIKSGQKWHYEQGRQGYEVVHSADYWRMHAQRALTMRAGLTGSLTLWGDDPDDHERFASEIVAERLDRHVPGIYYDMYAWITDTNTPHDLLDCVVGCYPAAAYLGVSMTDEKGGDSKNVFFEVW